jgi:hypothetical protein
MALTQTELEAFVGTENIYQHFLLEFRLTVLKARLV